MLGIGLFFTLSLGLGALLPVVRFSGRPSIGALWIGGYAILTGSIFFAHVALRLPMAILVWTLLVFALLALVKRLREGDIHWRALATHPCVVLTVFAALTVLAAGGIEYQPYAIDEFTNWLGVSRLIFWSGGYEAVRETVYLSGYTPGWRMLLTVPWFFTGTYDPGQSAAASLILHIGVAGLFFDLIRSAIDLRLPDAGRRSDAVAWVIVLLYLSVQATGAIWPYTLLIEQPQIYGLAAAAMLLFAIDGDRERHRSLCLVLGFVLMLAYLLKTAAVLLLPGAVAAILLLAILGNTASRSALPADLGITVGPVLIAMIAWALLKPDSNSCFSSPGVTLGAEALERAAAYDWGDLLRRFTSGVASYLTAYKWQLSVAAAAGIAAAVATRRYPMPLALITFIVLYFGALYWFHLTCFGPYNFETLASIERFTRVALQPVHAAGLLALAIVAVNLTPRRLLDSGLQRKSSTALLVVTGTALIMWQSMVLQRNIEDMTTRRHQNMDPRISEVRRAADFIKAQETYKAEPPHVQFVSQGTDSDILGYAKYYAVRAGKTSPTDLFTTANAVSWALGEQENVWQRPTQAGDLLETLRAADIIWPVVTEPWIDDLLRSLVDDGDCSAPLTERILQKTQDGAFVCRAKP